jgi:hypothetical protein
MVLLLSVMVQLLLLKAPGRACSTSPCATPNILKDVRVGITRGDITNNHTRCTLADFFSALPVGSASSIFRRPAPQHPQGCVCRVRPH